MNNKVIDDLMLKFTEALCHELHHTCADFIVNKLNLIDELDNTTQVKIVYGAQLAALINFMMKITVAEHLDKALDNLKLMIDDYKRRLKNGESGVKMRDEK